MRSAPPIVRCRGIAKSFDTATGPVQAVRGADLEVWGGEVVMIVGPSGCGKTTLISVIAATLDPDAGECRVTGRDLAALSPAEKSLFRRTSIGFVFQAFNLIPTLTIVENAAIPLLLAGVSRRAALARAASLLERLGLGERLSASPTALSGGQQQRVAIARACVHEPAIIVCDEPTSALDNRTGQMVIETLCALTRTTGRALLIVTHDNRIFHAADRIAEMDDGRIVRVGRPRPAAATVELEAAT